MERSNVTMRMHMRRFTQLTNAFSKKFENYVHMVALYTVSYNWSSQDGERRRQSAAGLTDRVWDLSDVLKMIGNRGKVEMVE